MYQIESAQLERKTGYVVLDLGSILLCASTVQTVTRGTWLMNVPFLNSNLHRQRLPTITYYVSSVS